MYMDFPEFQKAVQEADETMMVALQCAVFVLRCAHERPLDHRDCMIETVKVMISLGGKRDLKSPLKKYREGSNPYSGQTKY